MPIPTQQQLYRPVLQLVNDARGEIVSLAQIRLSLAERFSLTDDELAEKVPSGEQTRFVNRLYWAVSYLRRAGFLTSPSRAQFVITPPGSKLLASQLGEIRHRQLTELIELRRQKLDSEDKPDEAIPEHIEPDSMNATPDESMERLYRELSDRLADELLQSVASVTPGRFERLVVGLLERMGYGKGQVVGGSGDGGIDGIITQDPLGLEKVYVQAKRKKDQVGEPEIRNFSGSLQARGASKGVFITASSFNSRARETARLISGGQQFIRLINGLELAGLMISNDVGVVTETSYYVKKVDENYFADAF